MVGGAVAHPAAINEPCCRYLQVTIPDPTDRILAQGRALVRTIEALSTIERLDAEIDALVYELYGLTEEEIAVVEGGS